MAAHQYAIAASYHISGYEARESVLSEANFIQSLATRLLNAF
jgi:hypothetical protein